MVLLLICDESLQIAYKAGEIVYKGNVSSRILDFIEVEHHK
jgi:hypothetical protein